MTNGAGWFGQRSVAFWTVVSGIGTVASLVLGFAVTRESPMLPPQNVVTTITQPSAPTSVSPAPVADIGFTISDQLTDGVDEETVVVSIEGRRVATLHANRDDPITTKYVRARNPGSYSYVLDAVLIWTDDDGVLQRTLVTGGGDVYIRNGVRLDVYNHVDSDGDLKLSLQAATG